jgi:hypothetical protein
MIYIKFVGLIIAFVLFTKLSFGQDVYKAFDMGLYSGNKLLRGVNVYILTADTARRLPTFKDKIFLDTNYFRLKTVTFLVVYKHRQIVFKVKPDFFYIKIQILKENIPTSYQVSLSLESDYFVHASVRKFVLIE